MDILVETYLPPMTARAVQQACPTIIPSSERGNVDMHKKTIKGQRMHSNFRKREGERI